MAIDPGRPIGGAPRPQWELPNVLDIKIRRVPFQARKPRNFESALSDYKEAEEFMVQTDGPIPARALGPALFVGDFQVIESEQVEKNLYRFLAFNFELLKSGAPISWGWMDAPETERLRTEFRYE